MDNFSEEELIRLIRNGGRETDKGFKILVRQHGPMLFRQIKFITKNDALARDILQDVFIKVYQNINAFKGDSALYTWLYRIARNETLNTLKKESRRTGVDVDEPILEILMGSQDFVDLEADQIQDYLFEAINSLPEKQATVFQLKYFEDMKYSEISTLIGTSEGALKANYFHAREKISEFLLTKLNH